MKSRHERVVYVLVALGPLLLFGPMLLRGEVLFWGTPILQFVPWHDFALEVIRGGHFPFWNPLVGFGAPLFANYQSALIYPPNLLLALVGPAYGHGLLVALHLVWAGCGMVLLARRLGLPSHSQLLAGIAFSLSGYLVARGSFISINHTAAWLPWIIVACERLTDLSAGGKNRERVSIVLLLGVFFGFQWLAGHAQTSWYTLIFSIAWTTWRSLQRGGWNALFRNALWLGLAGMFGFILAGVQLIPTIEYLLLSQRSGGLDPELALTYSFWPWRLAGLVAPDLFGTPASGTYWGYGNYWEDAIYVGVFPLLMALGAVAKQFRKDKEARQATRFLLISVLIALTLAFGKNTPIFRFLYEHIPSFDLFQAPTRWNLLLVFSLALLAGIGVSQWRTPEGRGLYWTRLGTAGAGIIAVASYAGSWLLDDVEATFIPAIARAGVLLFAAGLLTLFLKKKNQWGMLLSIGLFVLMDLVTAGYGLNPVVDAGVFQGTSQLADEAEGIGRVYMPAELEQQLKFEQTHRFDTFNPDIAWRDVRDIGLPNTPMLDGVPSANNFDPFTPARYERWMMWLDSLQPDAQARVLRITGVRWRARWDEQGLLGVSYEDLGAVSRILLVPEAASGISSDAALTAFSSPGFDPSSQVLLEATGGPLPSGSGGGAVIQPDADPNQVVVETSAEQGGWLLLNDSWYPGWKVFIDGKQTDLHRANYLFMAAWIPEGEHLVVFQYRPKFFVAAALFSAIGWIAAILLIVRQRRR